MWAAISGGSNMADHFHRPDQRERWHRQLADEIAEILAHGGRGSFDGLVQHLEVLFGTIEAEDVRAAIGLLPAWAGAREAFQ